VDSGEHAGILGKTFLSLSHLHQRLDVKRITANIPVMAIQSFACPDTQELFTTGRNDFQMGTEWPI
jgi:hypothetical protein